MASIAVRPYRPNSVTVHPSVGGGGGVIVNGVIFEVIDDHILNLKGKISVNEDGIICL